MCLFSFEIACYCSRNKCSQLSLLALFIIAIKLHSNQTNQSSETKKG